MDFERGGGRGGTCNVETDAALLIDVGVVDLGLERDLEGVAGLGYCRSKGAFMIVLTLGGLNG